MWKLIEKRHTVQYRWIVYLVCLFCGGRLHAQTQIHKYSRTVRLHTMQNLQSVFVVFVFSASCWSHSSLTFFVTRLGFLITVGRVLKRFYGTSRTLRVLQLLWRTERDIRIAHNLANVRRVGRQRGTDTLSNGCCWVALRLWIAVIIAAIDAGTVVIGQAVRIAVGVGGQCCCL